jgi:nitroreductase
MEHGSSHRKPAFPIHSLFVDRWSPRAMSGEALSETALMSLLEAARWAPSCGNFQPWRFLYARRDTDFWPAFLDLINPSNRNGVKTYRGGLGEDIMSVADQYLARAGFSYSNASWKGFGASLGGRVEGVPVMDLVGGSDGFRRPGYAVSVEPGVSYSRGAHTFSLQVPIAEYRNRTRSVPDRLVPGRHGDAAFADYLILIGYWRKF